MKLFLRGNYTEVKKYEDIPHDAYKIIIKSGHGEHTVIDISKPKLINLREQISKILQASEGSPTWAIIVIYVKNQRNALTL